MLGRKGPRLLLLLGGLVSCTCGPPATGKLIPTLAIECPGSDASAGACTEMDFGDVPVGQQAARAVIVSDVGRAALSLSGSSWSADASAAFQAMTAPSTIAAGTHGAFEITFTPTMVGAATGTLTLSTNDPQQHAVAITVKGNGTGSIMPTLEPSAVDFGDVTVHTTATQFIQLRNSGNLPLTIVSMALVSGAPRFTLVAPDGTTSLAAGGSVTLIATYTPASAGPDTGEAQIVVAPEGDNAMPTTLTLPLTGRSMPVIQVTPASLDFGTVTLMSQVEQTLTISNAGKGPLDLQTIALSMDTSAVYSLSRPDSQEMTLAPGEQAAVRVTCQAQLEDMVMADTGSVVITSNDPATPTVTVPLTEQCSNCQKPKCPTWQNFSTTCGQYADTDDLAAACASEFGANAVVADWNQIKALPVSELPAFAQGVGLVTWDKDDTMLNWNGQATWNSTLRHYFITLHDHMQPTTYSFLVHDNVDNHYIDLGSWNPITMPVLCYRN